MNNKSKKIPQRRCAGCGERFEKKELIRIVRTPNSDIVLDPTGKVSGRGVYVCKKLACLKKAEKTGYISRSLDTGIPAEIYDELEQQIKVFETENKDDS